MCTLAVWAAIWPARAEDVQLSAFDRMEILYFKRGSVELSPVGVEKLGRCVQMWGRTGDWAIGIPRNMGASDQVTQGRIHALIGALTAQGVAGVKTIYTSSVPKDGFDPIFIGKLKPIPVVEIDPNDEDAPPSPASEAPPAAVPPVAAERAEPLPPPAPQTPPRGEGREPGPPQGEVLLPAVWMRFKGSFEYQSIHVDKPPTAKMEESPYQVLGIRLNLLPDTWNIDLGYSKTASNLFSDKEQAEPTRQLDVSKNSTNYYDKLALSMGGGGRSFPIRLSYSDEKVATTAVLDRGSLVFDATGAGWVSIVDQFRYAYKTRTQGFGLDWCFGSNGNTNRVWALGVYSDKIERPYSVYEYGLYTNNITYLAKLNVAGIHIKYQEGQPQEGFNIGTAEIKVGHSTGIKLVDIYQLINVDPSKNGFNKVDIRFSPYYMKNMGKYGFVKFSLPLGYSRLDSKTTTSVKPDGDGQVAGLYGNSYRYGLQMDLGVRF